MIRLVEGKENTIKVHVASSIDTTGFSASILFTNETKTLSSIKDGATYLLNFSPEEVAAIPSSPLFGAITILNGNGDIYQTNYVEIQKVPLVEFYKAIDFTEVSLSIAANWVGDVDDSGGGGGDMSKYATKVQLAQTSTADRQYTDEKVSDVIVDALENQTVTVYDAHGEPVQMTVKQSVQQSENLKSAVENLADTRLQGGTKEEYNDTIYLYTDQMPRKRKISIR
jgi:hypothetical protein